MTVLEIAMQKMQDLPQQRQQEVLDFIEFIALKSGSEFSDTISDNTEKENVSCYDLTKQWIGIGDDLPSDLSVNKSYLQDYFRQ
jgi:hypothetical protein